MTLVHPWVKGWVMPEHEWSSCHSVHMSQDAELTGSIIWIQPIIWIPYYGISFIFPGACLPIVLLLS